MTIVMTILASDNARNRRRAKRAAEREQVAGTQHISRIEKAVISPSLRDRHESTSQCLPEIAIFAASYRNSKDMVTAR
ncbi:hypothetical protein HFD87_10200 [Pantoea sp. EKM21T]|uniref:transcriptional antitermination N peptide n=1 Tax=unclassified Pantoea TaxID=2630326 RepID=UPI00142DC5A1|nr:MULTISPECIES: hypothetical protein [unclassified Pantoea]KAF6676836.1 hypothetical protein HFD87_10200 [Pantoea sp. EKM21T]KAF6685984.1 hypothetical protein HFD90_03805 [Pantoea sp. EKM22T]